MEYLKKYGITDEQIEKIKKNYSVEICEFLSKNSQFVENTINYLYSENIKCIYLLIIKNINIFLYTQVALKNKIEEYKRYGLSTKEIQMELLQER